jgi:hypothetical protein
METAGLIGVRLVALAGADYVKHLTDAGLTVAQPMKGKSTGKQLQWLNAENARGLTPPGHARSAS